MHLEHLQHVKHLEQVFDPGAAPWVDDAPPVPNSIVASSDGLSIVIILSEASCTADYTKLSVANTTNTIAATAATIVGRVLTITLDLPIFSGDAPTGPALVALDGWLIDAAGNHAVSTAYDIDVSGIVFDPTLGGTVSPSIHLTPAGINSTAGTIDSWSDESGNGFDLDYSYDAFPTTAGNGAVFNGTTSQLGRQVDTDTLDAASIFTTAKVTTGYATLGAMITDLVNQGTCSVRIDNAGLDRFRGPNTPNTNSGDFADGGAMKVDNVATDSFTPDHKSLFYFEAATPKTILLSLGCDQAFAGGGARHFKGTIWRVLCYPTALTAGQYAVLYAGLVIEDSL